MRFTAKMKRLEWFIYSNRRQRTVYGCKCWLVNIFGCGSLKFSSTVKNFLSEEGSNVTG